MLIEPWLKEYLDRVYARRHEAADVPREDSCSGMAANLSGLAAARMLIDGWLDR